MISISIGTNSRRAAAASGAVTISVSPTSVSQYEPATTLTVNGSGFTLSSVISIDGVAQTTTYVDATQLTCALPAGETAAAILANSGSKAVTVDGSNSQTFTVNAWSLLSLASLTAWYLAEASNITLNGSTVAQWADISGNGRHMVQATGTNQPTWTASLAALNNRGVVDCDGADNFMTGAALSAYRTASELTAIAAIVVDSCDTNASESNTWQNDQVFCDSEIFTGMPIRSSGNIGLSSFGAAAHKRVDTTYTDSVGQIISARHNGSNLYVRNGLGSEVNNATSENTGNLTFLMQIGRGYVSYSDLKIADLAFFNTALSTGDQERAIRYMKARYAI